MLRPSRPLTVWLLWLAIVLLPVRGWAAMPTASGPMALAADTQALVAQTTQTAQTVSIEQGQPLPCHAGSVASGNLPTCSLCDVCHSAVAVAMSVSACLPVLPSARPRIEPALVIERPVLDGPDRPPRPLLA